MHPTGEHHTISAGGVRAVVSEVGAVLRAFDVDGVPYCEPTDPDRDPPMGAGSVLVPWPNRVAGARWSWRGREYALEVTEAARGNAIHGLLRRVRWEPVAAAPDSVTLAADVAAGPGWPQALAVTTTYAVTDDPAPGLTVTHGVTNLGDDDVPAGVGTHPYPRAGRAATDDCTLHLAASTVLDVDDAMIPTGPARPVGPAEDFRGGAPLRGTDLDTAFGGCVPVDGAEHVVHELRAPDGSGVRLWADPAFEWVQVFTPGGFPRPEGEGRAVAIEPMTCPPDALHSGTDLAVLAPGETWTVRWGLTPLTPPTPPTPPTPRSAPDGGDR